MAGEKKHIEADLSQVSFEALIREMIVRLDPDPDREGMSRTPDRVAKSMEFLTRGYHMTPEDAIGDGIFEERHHNMVLVKDIELYSMCEHHLLPFFGKAHVAYIPDGKIMGLSKAARLVGYSPVGFRCRNALPNRWLRPCGTPSNPWGWGL